MHWLNYHHLLYFREIATQGSVSKAAEKLKIGQPALSGQLKTLELNLGHKLFDRHNKRLTLTPTGKLVLGYANEIHLSGRTLVDMLEAGSMQSQAHLNVGVLDSVPKHLILQLINDATEFSPCQVHITGGSSDELLRELQSHNLDLLITNQHAPIADRGGLFSKCLSKNEISVFSAPSFVHLKKSFPASLDMAPFILPSFQCKLRHDIDHFFRLNNISVRIFAETLDTSIQKLLSSDGHGLIALAEFSAKELISERKLVKLGTMDGVFEELWIISTKKVIENPIVNHLTKHFFAKSK